MTGEGCDYLRLNVNSYSLKVLPRVCRQWCGSRGRLWSLCLHVINNGQRTYCSTNLLREFLSSTRRNTALHSIGKAFHSRSALCHCQMRRYFIVEAHNDDDRHDAIDAILLLTPALFLCIVQIFLAALAEPEWNIPTSVWQPQGSCDTYETLTTLFGSVRQDLKA